MLDDDFKTFEFISLLECNRQKIVFNLLSEII